MHTVAAAGYGSVRWWHIFTLEQCDAVNRLLAYFAMPFFTLEFTLHTDPFQVDCKAVIVTVIACWARLDAPPGAVAVAAANQANASKRRR